MTQVSLWQDNQRSAVYAELCNALYERELSLLASAQIGSVGGLQGRLKSLPHYIKRLADFMENAEAPLTLDSQNASWNAKQLTKKPVSDQSPQATWQWFCSFDIDYGLVVPVELDDRIVLDSIDRVDINGKGIRTNRYGWFTLSSLKSTSAPRLLKPNKKVMSAASAGHVWTKSGKTQPDLPPLREMLLSCFINWRNFKKLIPVERD